MQIGVREADLCKTNYRSSEKASAQEMTNKIAFAYSVSRCKPSLYEALEHK